MIESKGTANSYSTAKSTERCFLRYCFVINPTLKKSYISIFAHRIRMFRQIASILLIFLFLLPGLSRIWIYVDFKIHQDFIAEVLCINRDKPETMCSGTCYLNKKLKDAEEKEEKQLPQVLKEKAQLAFFVPMSSTMNQAVTASERKHSFYPKNQITGTDYLHKPFRPPKQG